MKRFISILIVSLIFLKGMSAQECDTPITVAMPEHIEGLNEAQKSYLCSKMEQLVVSQGVSSDFSYTQFVLTADVSGMQKDVVPTIPSSVTCQYDVVFKLVDRAGMKTMAVQSVNVRGAGSTEAKAMQNALRLINPQNKNLIDFIKGAKSKVLAYYNQHVPQIVSQSRRLANLDKYEEAFNLLASVPECCNQYNEVTREIIAIYPKARDKVGEKFLKEARRIWTVDQTGAAAEEACYWLSLIDPKSSAYAGGERLYAEIKGRVKEEVQHEMKVYDDNVDLIKQQINAAKEIGMAYGKGQQTEINVIK
ncbi:hypothetical protein [uncultured Bacteroides sp.]|uniref:hypothetical protein n=1 Tax=uncultured Bacteroides sp. TaxID=162156 RepID=UPI0025E16E1A|nr:hypothetical protein [uncultured Bacteroides sp.]